MRIPLTEAQEVLEREVALLPSESLSVEVAGGRWLLEDAEAGWDLPKKNESAMDGWGVDHLALVNATPSEPVTLSLASPTHAGDKAQELPEGCCAWVGTGAPIPKGATAVVPWEEASAETEGVVSFDKGVTSGRSVRRQAEDIHKGDLLATKGVRLTPWSLQSLFSGGVESVTVAPIPKVAIIASGDELYMPGTKPPFQDAIPCGNLIAIANRAKKEGCKVVAMELIPDNKDALIQAVSDGEKKADLVITIGGAAGGKKDFARLAFEKAGAEMLVPGLILKPGGPSFITRWDSGTIGLGLAGNPLSALIVFEILGLQILRHLVGARRTRMTPLETLLDAPIIWKSSKPGFVPAEIVRHSPLTVAPVQPEGSHRVEGLARTEMLLRFSGDEGEVVSETVVEGWKWT